jgi:hypothetical protein
LDSPAAEGRKELKGKVICSWPLLLLTGFVLNSISAAAVWGNPGDLLAAAPEGTLKRETGEPGLLREMTFRCTKPIGIVRAGVKSCLFRSGWVEIGQAFKTVKIPRGMEVVDLTVYEHTADISALRYLRSDDLQALSMHKASLTDSQLASIENLTGLRSLNLNDNPITDRGMLHLKRLRNLEVLELIDLPFTDRGLAVVKNFPGLRKLNLNGTLITDRGLLKLQGLHKLEVLSLVHDKITDKGLAVLKNFPLLTDLDCGDTAITGSGLSWLKKPGNCPIYLDVSKTDFDDHAVASLRNIHAFRALLLNETRFSDVGLARLLKQSAIATIILKRTNVNGSGFASLCGNEITISDVNLDETNFNDKGMSYLARCKNLVSLSLNNTQVTDTSMSNIASLTKLRTLHLRHTALTDVAVPYLAKILSLRELDLPNKISRAAAFKLKQALPQCKIRRVHIGE